MEKFALDGPDINPTVSDKDRLIWEVSSGLHKKTLFIFILLIMTASLLCGVAIYHHILTTAGKTETTMVEGDSISKAAGQVTEEHRELEQSITYIAFALIVTLIFFMIFFIRNIVLPLKRLEKLTGKMADGRLDLLVGVNTGAGRTIGSIGENVNSLAMNMQEILLLVWNHSEHNLKSLERTLDILSSGADRTTDIEDNLLMMKNELLQVQELTRQFEFFDVTLETKKAIAKDSVVNP